MAMTLRLSPEQQARYAAQARREGLSVQQWITRCCDAAVEASNHRSRVLGIGQEVAAHSAELYKRLA